MQNIGEGVELIVLAVVGLLRTVVDFVERVDRARDPLPAKFFQVRLRGARRVDADQGSSPTGEELEVARRLDHDHLASAGSTPRCV